ncbi:hypothetical protein ACOSP7_022227 [Xanthoceras sorbifolium]
MSRIAHYNISFFFLPPIAAPLHPYFPTPQIAQPLRPCAQPLRPCDCAPAPPRSYPYAPATVPLPPRPCANCVQPHLAHLRSPSPSLAQPLRTGRK